ncbi:putative bisphosphate nucleotidase [Halotydeus destructor]|nr:putative bisphosphate nucleotidase [Halotydeus destructor]
MAASKGVNLLKLVSASVFAANQAGKIVRDVLKKGQLGIIDKGGLNNLQTEADRSAQQCIVQSLQKLFPGVPVIGEEDDDVGSSPGTEEFGGYDDAVLAQNCPEEFTALNGDDIVVWVDPLDGTAEYVHGLLDHVTVLIGISLHGKAIGGVIHQPYYNYKSEEEGAQLGRTIWAIQKVGAFGITKTAPPEGQFIVTTTRSHGNAVINASITSVNPTDVLRVGGAGHKALLVIEGQAHSYIFASSGCKKWDTCAPEAVLREVGGIFTDMFGNDIQYHRTVDPVNRTGVLASFDQESHDRCRKMIPAEVLQGLLPSSL